MRDGPCLECGPSDVHVGQGYDSQGLHAHGPVEPRVSGIQTDVDTYVRLACGLVRLFVADRSRGGLACLVSTRDPWRRAAGGSPK